MSIQSDSNTLFPNLIDAYDFFVHDSELHCLRGAHVCIPFQRVADFLLTSVRVTDKNIRQRFPRPFRLFTLDQNLSRLAADHVVRLMDHDSRIREGVSLAFLSGG